MTGVWITMALAASLSWAQEPPEDEHEPINASPATSFDFSAVEVSGALRAAPRAAMAAGYGATPGGAQDIAYFRDRVRAGEVPPPEVFTAEGLFSEHDLPLTGRACERLLCTNTKAVRASFPAQPEVTHLVQVGFDSGLTDETFRRSPLNLVMVIDKSGSMSEELPMVREGLRQVLSHLGPEDQLSIVLYGSTVHTLLAPTRATDRGVILAAIDQIVSQGSTAMEAGLAEGYRVARESRRAFDGTTRVMLFTDEQPNVGRTDADAFMTMAREASLLGIGTTTLGVGVDFGAELAQQVSSVRGGNLFFFRDPGRMAERLDDDFDTMVTTLAYDLDLEIQPAPGTRIAGVYGLPGDALSWTPEGAIRLRIETVFLSKDRGGIYVGLADAPGGGGGDGLAVVNLSYEPRDGAVERSSTPARIAEPGPGDEGLSRGLALVDEFTTLRDATGRYQRGDLEGALERIQALSGRLARIPDASLEPERDLVSSLAATLARQAGRPLLREELSRRDPISGLPIR